MTDLQETPAVPPMDPGGDERIGFHAAGSLLVLLGWGVGVFLNLVLHWTAPAAGRRIGPYVLFPALGPYAMALLLFGAVTGLLGIAILWIARSSPKGPLVLPGFAY